MRPGTKLCVVGLFGVLLVTGALDPGGVRMLAQEGQAPVDVGGQPTFRLSVDLVTTDVIVRDRNDVFLADLVAEDFEVYEDGVRQELASLGTPCTAAAPSTC